MTRILPAILAIGAAPLGLAAGLDVRMGPLHALTWGTLYLLGCITIGAAVALREVSR